MRADLSQIGRSRHSCGAMDDADVFAELYERESQMILAFVARRTLDAEVALDITAETFAQAFRARRSFRGSSDPERRAWLLTIARRQIGRYLRRGVVERRALERLGVMVPLAHEDDLRAIEDAAQLAELRATLSTELDRLRSGQREALWLRVIEERSYVEIAAALDISEQTARARVSRGLRSLGRALDATAVVPS